MVSGVGRGMGELDGVGDRRREGAVLGVNLGVDPIITNGICCVVAEVRVAIELSFEVVSWVGPGIDVLDGVHVPQGERAVSGIFRHLRPRSFEWAE